MLRSLAAFASLSMAGTVLLSLLPEGGIKRTAAMAVGLMTLMCWAESIASVLGLELFAEAPSSALSPTAFTLDNAAADAAALLERLWEAP